MREWSVIVAIGDPWDVGEAVGWKTPVARLSIESDEHGHISLEEGLLYKGSLYREFSVRTRYEGTTLAKVSEESIACNFESNSGSKKLRFTGSLALA